MIDHGLSLQAPWLAKPQLLRAEAVVAGFAAVFDRAVEILTITPDQERSDQPQMARYWYGSLY